MPGARREGPKVALPALPKAHIRRLRSCGTACPARCPSGRSQPCQVPMRQVPEIALLALHCILPSAHQEGPKVALLALPGARQEGPKVALPGFARCPSGRSQGGTTCPAKCPWGRFPRWRCLPCQVPSGKVPRWHCMRCHAGAHREGPEIASTTCCCQPCTKDALEKDMSAVWTGCRSSTAGGRT